jgi:hypothetical protein
MSWKTKFIISRIFLCRDSATRIEFESEKLSLSEKSAKFSPSKFRRDICMSEEQETGLPIIYSKSYKPYKIVTFLRTIKKIIYCERPFFRPKLQFKFVFLSNSSEKKNGLVRESNPGPLTPEARIMPLDQRANYLDERGGGEPYTVI